MMSSHVILGLAERTLRVEAEGILDLIPRLDARFLESVLMLHNCKGRVIVTGMGKSGIVGRKISGTLASTGSPSYFLHPAEAVHGDLGMVTRDDVVLALSKSGETEELLAILPQLKRLGVPLILMTGNPSSTLAKQSDLILDVSVEEEACPMNLAPTASTTAALALGDALAMVLIELKGFRPEEFAALHPRGTLGWRALFRVEDLMHTGKAVPKVTEDAFIAEVIREMTEKGLGVATVVNSCGKLVGVFTDGDLRRLHLREDPILSLQARDAMTRSPVLIRKDDLAAKALQVMESRAITSIIVVDDLHHPIGIIHMHDILRAKVI